MEKLFSTLFTSAEDNEITEALDDETENLILNSDITDDEILNAVKSLKLVENRQITRPGRFIC